MLETNKIHLGDSYELIKQIPDKSVDLVIIDPPYEYKHIDAKKISTYGMFKDRKGTYSEEINGSDMAKGFDISILDELVRVMKRIYIYIWCSREQIHKLLNYFDKKGITFEIIIWNKTNPTPTINNSYLPDKEYCLMFREKGTKMNIGTYETKRTVIQHKLNMDDKNEFNHPTIKPLSFIKNFIINSSDEGDLILDCFSGSGTTCVACKETGRQFIGIEIDPTYHRMSVDRLNGINASGQTSIFTDFEQIATSEGEG